MAPTLVLGVVEGLPVESLASAVDELVDGVDDDGSREDVEVEDEAGSGLRILVFNLGSA